MQLVPRIDDDFRRLPNAIVILSVYAARGTSAA